MTTCTYTTFITFLPCYELKKRAIRIVFKSAYDNILKNIRELASYSSRKYDYPFLVYVKKIILFVKQ